MSRRPLIGACLCTIALVTVGCSDGSKGAKSASTDKPGAVSTAKTTMSTNVKTGNGVPTTMKAGIASRILRPVGVGQPAELAHNLFASVTHVEVATLTAQAPGETSGPGAFVTVTVRNDTDAAVDLGGLAVNVHYGNRIPATQVRELKKLPGHDLLLSGSAQLFHALMQENVIDLYRFMLHPVVLGKGKRLFADGGGKTVLALAETKKFSSGIVILEYAPAKTP